MTKLLPAILLASVFHLSMNAQLSSLQKKAINYINTNQFLFTGYSDSIWQYAEPSFREFKSTSLLINVLKKEGFTIQENVSGFPTVFIATYGNAGPVIGLYGEYDADPNASNKTVPFKEELVKGGYGHGGAHNLLGVGSLATSLAIKELIKKGELNCTIRYYGSTAEGGLGTRAYLARDGYFNDLDLSLYWHPAPVTWASTSTWDALIDFDITFAGKRIDVIRNNTIDINTQKAVEYFMTGMKNLRNVITPLVKFNYQLNQKKTDLNIVADTAVFLVRIQCAKQTDALRILDSIKKIANEAALHSMTTASLKVNRALHQFLPNITAMKQVQKEMELLGPLTYTNDEIDFALKMQKFVKAKPDTIKDRVQPFSDASKGESLYGYASDIGEASWIAPEIYFIVRSFPSGVNMHTWQGAAFTAHPIGHKGMLHAAKLMSMMIIDYVKSKTLQDEIQKEFEVSTRDYKYKSIIPEPH